MKSTIEEGRLTAINKRLRIARDVQSGRFKYVNCPLCSGEAAMGGHVGSTLNSLVQCTTCGDYQICHEAAVNLVESRRLAPKDIFFLAFPEQAATDLKHHNFSCGCMTLQETLKSITITLVEVNPKSCWPFKS